MANHFVTKSVQWVPQSYEEYYDFVDSHKVVIQDYTYYPRAVLGGFEYLVLVEEACDSTPDMVEVSREEQEPVPIVSSIGGTESSFIPIALGNEQKTDVTAKFSCSMGEKSYKAVGEEVRTGETSFSSLPNSYSKNSAYQVLVKMPMKGETLYGFDPGIESQHPFNSDLKYTCELGSKYKEPSLEMSKKVGEMLVKVVLLPLDVSARKVLTEMPQKGTTQGNYASSMFEDLGSLVVKVTDVCKLLGGQKLCVDTGQGTQCNCVRLPNIIGTTHVVKPTFVKLKDTRWKENSVFLVSSRDRDLTFNVTVTYSFNIGEVGIRVEIVCLELNCLKTVVMSTHKTTGAAAYAWRHTGIAIGTSILFLTGMLHKGTARGDYAGSRIENSESYSVKIVGAYTILTLQRLNDETGVSIVVVIDTGQGTQPTHVKMPMRSERVYGSKFSVDPGISLPSSHITVNPLLSHCSDCSLSWFLTRVGRYCSCMVFGTSYLNSSPFTQFRCLKFLWMIAWFLYGLPIEKKRSMIVACARVHCNRDDIRSF